MAGLPHKSIASTLKTQFEHFSQRHYDEIPERYAFWNERHGVVQLEVDIIHGCYRCYATLKKLEGLGFYSVERHRAWNARE